MTDELPDPPEPTAADTPFTIARVAGNFRPGVGAAVELVESVLGSPFNQRRQEWYVCVAEVLRELQRRQVPTVG